MKRKPRIYAACTVLVCAGLLAAAFARDRNPGQLEFAPAGKIEKLAGVWVDGQYVGRLSKIKVILVSGEHQVIVRRPGYQDFVSTVTIEPETVLTLPIQLEADPKAQAQEESSEMKITVKPNRAAVYINGGYVGRVNEFDGPWQAMVLPPGTYSLLITLEGYTPFETRVTLAPAQKYHLKADLVPEAPTSRGSASTGGQQQSNTD